MNETNNELETLRAEVERLRKLIATLRYAASAAYDAACAGAQHAPEAFMQLNAAISEISIPADAGSTLPSVAGRMEMTHQCFQRACQFEIGELQQDPNSNNAILGLLCEAVRCSRECCELAKTGLQIPSTFLTREQVQPLVDALEAVGKSHKHFNQAGVELIEHAIAHARTIGFP
jgi:hypothetical protein